MDSDPSAALRRGLLWLPASLVLVGAVFLADWFTGAEISVSFFYLFPVALATWMLGRRAGVALSLLSAAGWAGAYFLSGRFYSQPRIIFWNTAVEVAIFLTVTFALASAHEGMIKEQALTRQLEVAYRELDGEMRVVGEIQRSLLPEAPPAIPGYRVAVHYSTSARAGGDYYDFFPLPDGRVGLLIADVSGHGTPAAVVMAMLRVVLHTAPSALAPPEHVLAMANRRLRDQTLVGQFVTACYATLDHASGHLEYAIAGHNPPLLVRAGCDTIEELENPSGLPLGPFDAPTFLRRCARLAPGDTVLFYTDGLIEACDRFGELFGLEQVKRLLARHRDAPPEALRDRLLEAVNAYIGSAPAADDMTLIVLRAG